MGERHEKIVLSKVEKLKKKNRELKAELEAERKRADEGAVAAAVRAEKLTGERDGAVRLQEAATSLGVSKQPCTRNRSAIFRVVQRML